MRGTCRLRGWGLLVTAHQDVGLPTLFHVVPTIDTARAIVAQLVGPLDAAINARMIEADFQSAGGNLREMLFLLYDRYEHMRDERKPTGSVGKTRVRGETCRQHCRECPVATIVSPAAVVTRDDAPRIGELLADRPGACRVGFLRPVARFLA